MKPERELLFWNFLGSMQRKWLSRIPPGRAFNLLRLWNGYEFTDLMDSDGCFVSDNFNHIRARLKVSTWAIVENDLRKSNSFLLFGDPDADPNDKANYNRVEKFCSPIWHTPTKADGSLLPGSWHEIKSVTNCDSLNNENINKQEPQKEKCLKEKDALRDGWAEGFSKSYPTLGRMKEPLTEEQYMKLLQKFTREMIKKKLQYMNNYRDIEKKYTSVYLTLNNWLSNP